MNFNPFASTDNPLDMDPERIHLVIIHRVKSNNPILIKLSIGDITHNKPTAILLAEALCGNTHLRRVTVWKHVYGMDHFHIILSQTCLDSASVPDSKCSHTKEPMAIPWLWGNNSFLPSTLSSNWI